jgi:hypothetical protein
MGSTKIENPTAPAAPTQAQTAADYAASLPTYYNAQLQYDPLVAAQQLQLTQQYALPYAQALQQANDALYPNTSKLQEQLSQQALEGMNSEVPDWMQQQYKDNFNANLGTNVGSGKGAEGMSLGLMGLKQDWQNYYQNMGLSLAGRQPLQQATQTQGLGIMNNYTPSTGSGYAANTYGNYSNVYGQMYGANAQTAQAGNPYFNAIAGMGGTALGGWMGGWGKK